MESSLLNKIADFGIKLIIFEISNLFKDMLVKQHFVLNLIWNFYEAKIYYSDKCFSPLFWCFSPKRHPAVESYLLDFYIQKVKTYILAISYPGFIFICIPVNFSFDRTLVKGHDILC